MSSLKVWHLIFIFSKPIILPFSSAFYAALMSTQSIIFSHSIKENGSTIYFISIISHYKYTPHFFLKLSQNAGSRNCLWDVEHIWFRQIIPES